MKRWIHAAIEPRVPYKEEPYYITKGHEFSQEAEDAATNLGFSDAENGVDRKNWKQYKEAMAEEGFVMPKVNPLDYFACYVDAYASVVQTFGKDPSY